MKCPQNILIFQVKIADQLPFNICSLCVALCDAAYNFREMCEQSDRRIRMGNMKIITIQAPTTFTSIPPSPITDHQYEMGQPFQESIVNPVLLGHTNELEENTQVLGEFLETSEQPSEVVHDEMMTGDDELPHTGIITLDDGQVVMSEETEDGEEEVFMEEYEERHEDEEHDKPKAQPQHRIQLNETLDGIEVQTYPVEPTMVNHCQFCAEDYKGKMALLDHYAEQHQDETYNCANCSQVFNSLNKWRSHLCRRPKKETRVSANERGK